MELFEYLDMSADGQITFIDELDANINDVYLDKLIEYFILYGNGQLCFTAHNLSPMSLLKRNKESINFISSINTVHTWANNGNQTPARAYRNGFIEDSPFNVDASDFLEYLEVMMSRQILLCVETNSKARTDYQYINETIHRFYVNDPKISYKPIFRVKINVCFTEETERNREIYQSLSRRYNGNLFYRFGRL